MGLKFVFVFAVLIVSFLLVDAGRRNNGRRSRIRSRNREPEGARYVWSRDLGDGTTVEETAITPTDRNQIYLRSTDDLLTAAGFTKSITLYDFSGTTPRVSMSFPDRGRQSPCYIADPSLTYQEAVDILTARNGTVAPLGAQLSLDGLDVSERTGRRVCKTGKTVRTTVTPDGSTIAAEQIRLLTLDSVVNLRVPAATDSAPAGRGRQRGGGRARGARGRNQANDD